ncbi:hypothetical protein GWI33_023407 [Rhynchophorus ferrugineus]|uniref:Uncharacterized protein n=1 Tax=Rhynchophorus ferrugineus TaxID=354439 RepID=A0A834IM95_RHYFE|nr:hypothetical protein GWI33_023407 [Rhynchophorus ferrugineus]
MAENPRPNWVLKMKISQDLGRSFAVDNYGDRFTGLLCSWGGDIRNGYGACGVSNTTNIVKNAIGIIGMDFFAVLVL